MTIRCSDKVLRRGFVRAAGARSFAEFILSNAEGLSMTQAKWVVLGNGQTRPA